MTNSDYRSRTAVEFKGSIQCLEEHLFQMIVVTSLYFF